MGKYSNVDINNLLNITKTALSELKGYNLDVINNNINNRNVFDTLAKNTIIDAINNVQSSKNINGSIRNLEDMLNDLKTAAEYIKKYQELEREIEELEEDKYKRKYDSETDSYDWVINTRVVNLINRKKIILNNYEEKIDKLLM